MTHTSSSSTWMSCPKPNPQADMRLFCFPYAGGGASLFRSWIGKLPVQIEVYLIQLPGRENRFLEEPYTTIASLVEDLAPQMRPYLQEPFACFGHSLGALVSFELARYLRLHALPQPHHLLVSACRAPQLPSPKPPIHALPDAEFIAALRLLEGTPEELLQHEELMELMLPTLRADFSLYETFSYRQEEPFTFPLTIFGGKQDHEVTQEELLAWQEQTTAVCKQYIFPAGHFFLHSEQAAVLQTIGEVLRVTTGRG